MTQNTIDTVLYAAEAARLGTSVCGLREKILRECAEQALPCMNHCLVAEMYAHVNTYLMRCLQKEDLYVYMHFSHFIRSIIKT